MNIKYMTPRGVSSWFKRTKKIRKILFVFSLIVIIVILPIAYLTLREPSVALADTLVKLDEGSGSSAGDQQGNVTGTIANAVWKTDDLCFDGKCLYFDGTGDLVSFGDDADLDFTGSQSFTITLWFRHAPMTSGQQVLVAKYDSTTGTDGGYKILMESDGDITFGIDDDQTSFPEDWVTSTAATYDDNQWHQVEAVKNGSSSMSLYIDTNLIGTTNLTSTGNVDNSDTFYLGMDGNGSSNGWVGFLDELKVYRSARSASGIKGDFAKNSSSGGTSASFGISDLSYLSNGLVGFWKLDETSTGAAQVDRSDTSGNGNTLTDSNTTASAAGKFGSAADIERDNTEYLSITDASQTGLDLSSTFTLAVWFKAESYDTCSTCVQPLIRKRESTGGASSEPYSLSLYGDAGNGFTLQANVGDTTTTGESFLSDEWLDLNTWYHAVFVFDKGVGTLYLNGVQAGTNMFSFSSVYNSDAEFYLGSWINDYFDGEIDDARVYNRALSSREVSSLYSWGPGPNAWWKMDENSGTSAADSSGNGNNSTSFSSTLGWKPGKYGSAVNFPGIDNRILVADSNSLDLPYPNITLEAWVYWQNNDDGHENIFIKNQNYSLRISEYGTSDIEIASQYWDGTNMHSYYSSDISTKVNQWIHIAVVLDPNTYTTTGKIYLNGIPVYAAKSSSAAGRDLTNTLAIGGNATDAVRDFKGNIDEIRIYNYQRSQTQIVEDMNAGHPYPGSPVGSPVGYWKFDDAISLTSSIDSSINQNTLTLSGSPTWTHSGQFGKALTFNGSGQYGYAADSASLSITGSLTLSAWIKPSAVTAGKNYVIAGKWQAANNAYLLTQYGDEIRMYIGSSSNYKTTDAANLTTGNWYYVAGIYNATTQTVDLYVNGSKQAGTTTGTIPSSISDDASQFRIGYNSTGTDVNKTVSADTDDGNQWGSSWYQGSMWVGNDTGDETGVTRFTSIAIAQGASIKSAVWQGYWITADNFPTYTKVKAEAINSASAPSASNLPSNMTLTTNGTDMDFLSGSVNTWKTADITAAIQEIIDRAGWSSGNAMNIVISNDGSTSVHDMEFYDRAAGTTSVAKLDITYGGDDYYNGTIDEVKVYSSSLTEDQVKLDMNKSSSALLGATTQKSQTSSFAQLGEYCIPGDTATCNGPIGEWNFEEGAQVVYDTSGNGNSGQLGSSSGSDANDPYWDTGKVGKAPFFNSLSGYGYTNADYILTNDIFAMDWGDTDDFTLEAWINVYADNGSNRTIIGKWNCCSYPGWKLHISTPGTGGRVTLFVRDASNSYEVAGTTALELGRWYHVVAVFDQDSTTNTTVYVNGIDDKNTTTGTLSSVGSTANDNYVQIGAHGYPPSTVLYDAFFGKIDQVRVYNYARTPAQILWSYNRGKPIAWYKLDDCSGTVAYNSAVNSNGDAGGMNGTITIGASGSNTSAGTCSSGTSTEAWNNGTTGKRNYSLDFDGADDYVEASDNDNLDFNDTSDLTITGWFKRGTDTTDDVIIAKRNGIATTDVGYILYIDDATDKLTFEVSDNPDEYQLESTSTFTDTNWHHFAIVWDESSASGSEIYIDGLANNATDTGTIGNVGTLVNAVTLRLGSESDGANYFDGQLDEVMLYRYALTPAQIKTDYNQGTVRFGPTTGHP